MPRPALIIVDVQNDFCPGGTLAVKNGDEVVYALNLLITAFSRRGFPIMFTRDWHPPNHRSFKSQGGPWPSHCVIGTRGAEFHPNLEIPLDAGVVSKGSDPQLEAYSGFQGTSLELGLKTVGVEELFVGGLATDYCVKQTALDGLRAGFKVTVIEDSIRPVEVREGDGRRAIEEMRNAGCSISDSRSVLRKISGA